MQDEMNGAAEQGYRFQGVMGGETAFAGSEVVVIMMRGADRRPLRLPVTRDEPHIDHAIGAAGGRG